MYLTQSLHRNLQRHPDRVAVRSGTLVRSYREFAARVARLAGGLRNLGLKSGDRVAMLSMNSDVFMEYQFGVPWAGGAMNPCNIRWSMAEILYSLDDSESGILIVDAAFAAMAGELRARSRFLRHVVHCGAGPTPVGMLDYESLLAASDPVPDACRRGNDLAGVFYTGGTTGFPKGVMLSHDNLCSAGLAFHASGVASPNACYLHAAPMFHLGDTGIAMAHWLEGSTHTFAPGFHPETLLQVIERERVSHVILVPTMIQMLIDHPAMQRSWDLGCLQSIIYGASPISEALLDRSMAVLPGVAFSQVYGMTELGPIATINPAHFHTDEGRRLGKLRSAGRAAPCVELRIVDAEDREVQRGTVGEVVVRGPNVMLGYWRRPEESAAALRGGWMHTGDGAWMDDEGFVFVVDRLKDMIISGGENVFSSEVENAVAQHPSVAMCAVIGIPHDKWGESVHAVVVLRPGAVTTEADLISHCKSLIAGYKCPSSVEFVDALPLSAASKVLKSSLREAFWKGRTRQVA